MSIIQVKGGGGGSVVLDRTSFVGARVPHEIHLMTKILPTLEKDTISGMIKIVISAIQGKQPNLDKVKSFINEKFNEEKFAIVYCGLDKLLIKALRIPAESLKRENFIQDLLELQIPEKFHDILVACVFGSMRPQIDTDLERKRPRLPSLEHLDWRIDVAISTGVLNRVLVRGVTMEMTMSDGSKNNFEMTVSKFQDLRFQVASVLSEMEKLEQRSILKIKD